MILSTKYRIGANNATAGGLSRVSVETRTTTQALFQAVMVKAITGAVSADNKQAPLAFIATHAVPK